MKKEDRVKHQEKVIKWYADGIITDDECNELLDLYSDEVITEEEDTYNWDIDNPSECNWVDDNWEQQYE
jgi:hypothetical protein